MEKKSKKTKIRPLIRFRDKNTKNSHYVIKGGKKVTINDI